MSFIADKLSAVKPSATLAVTAKAAMLKRQGRDILALGAGEPDFPTPLYICEAATKAMQDGKTKYAPANGIPELREAISQKFKRDNNLHYDPSQVIVSCGGKSAIYGAFVATLNPGDEVIIPAPYWVSYVDITVLAGGSAVIVDCPQEQHFKITPQQLRKAITPKTKWFILNSPSNPTGVCYSRAEIKALADVLMEKANQHVYILSDDIYEHIVYAGFEFSTIASVEPKLQERTLTMNGLSKAYSMTGWRVGYGAGPIELIKAMTKVQAQSITSTSTISQWASVAALNGNHDFMAKNNAIFKQRRDLVVNAIQGIDGLSCPTPQGAFYLYTSCQGLIGRKTPQGAVLKDDETVAGYFLDSVGVAVVHGAAFGKSPAFRISYATSTDILEEACIRLKKACDILS